MRSCVCFAVLFQPLSAPSASALPKLSHTQSCHAGQRGQAEGRPDSAVGGIVGLGGVGKVRFVRLIRFIGGIGFIRCARFVRRSGFIRLVRITGFVRFIGDIRFVRDSRTGRVLTLD